MESVRVGPLVEFHRAIEGLSAESLEPFLHPDVRYTVSGFRAVDRRYSVVSYWRRVFSRMAAIQITVTKQIQDGDIIISSQTYCCAFLGRSAVSVESMAVYELNDGLIRLWGDNIGDGSVEPEIRAILSRLRDDRW